MPSVRYMYIQYVNTYVLLDANQSQKGHRVGDGELILFKDLCLALKTSTLPLQLLLTSLLGVEGPPTDERLSGREYEAWKHPQDMTGCTYKCADCNWKVGREVPTTVRYAVIQRHTTEVVGDAMQM